MSDLRDWLISALSVDFAIDKEVTSKWHGSVFAKWTDMSQESLDTTWVSSPTYTTCTSFLTNVHRRIMNSGYAAGAPSFLPSTMDCSRPGWHSLSEYFDSDQSPQAGDFFLNREGTEFKHVGLFFDVGDGYCTVIAGGGGGKKKGYDSIIRKTLIFPLVNFVGWLNIDEFYG